MDLEVIYYHNLRLNSLNTVNDNDLIILIASYSKLFELPNLVFYSGTIFLLSYSVPCGLQIRKVQSGEPGIALDCPKIGQCRHR